MMLWSKDFCRVNAVMFGYRLSPVSSVLWRAALKRNFATQKSWTDPLLSEQTGHGQWNACPVFSEQVSVGFPSAES